MFGLTALLGTDYLLHVVGRDLDAYPLSSALPLMFADELIRLHEFPREVAPFSDRFEGLTAAEGCSNGSGLRPALLGGSTQGHPRTVHSLNESFNNSPASGDQASRLSR
jgi:hypothetical protein